MINPFSPSPPPSLISSVSTQVTNSNSTSTVSTPVQEKAIDVPLFKKSDQRIWELHQAGLGTLEGKPIKPSKDQRIIIDPWNPDNASIFKNIFNLFHEQLKFQSQFPFDTIPQHIKSVFSYYSLAQIFHHLIACDQDYVQRCSPPQEPQIEAIELIGSRLYQLLGAIFFTRFSEKKFSAQLGISRIQEWINSTDIQKRFIPQNCHADIDIQVAFRSTSIEQQQQLGDCALDCIAARIPRSHVWPFQSLLLKEHPNLKEILTTEIGIRRTIITKLGGVNKLNTIFNEFNQYTIQSLTPENHSPIEIKYYKQLNPGHLYSIDALKLNIKPLMNAWIKNETSTTILFASSAPYSVEELLFSLLCRRLFIANSKTINECHLPKLCTYIAYEDMGLGDPLEAQIVQAFLNYKQAFLDEYSKTNANDNQSHAAENTDSFYIYYFLKKWIKNHHHDHPESTLAFVWTFCEFLKTYSKIADSDIKKAISDLDQFIQFDPQNSEHQVYLLIKKVLTDPNLSFNQASAWLQLLIYLFFPESLTKPNEHYAFQWTIPQSHYQVGLRFDPLQMAKQLSEMAPQLSSLMELNSECSKLRSLESLQPSPLAPFQSQLPSAQKELTILADRWIQSSHPDLTYLGLSLHLANWPEQPSQQLVLFLFQFLPNAFQPNSLQSFLNLLRNFEKCLAREFPEFAQVLSTLTSCLSDKAPLSQDEFNQAWISTLIHSASLPLIRLSAARWRENNHLLPETKALLGPKILKNLGSQHPSEAMAFFHAFSQQSFFTLEHHVVCFIQLCQTYRNWSNFHGKDLDFSALLDCGHKLLEHDELTPAIQRDLQNQAFEIAMSQFLEMGFALPAPIPQQCDQLLSRIYVSGCLSTHQQSIFWMNRLSQLLNDPNQLVLLTKLYMQANELGCLNNLPSNWLADFANQLNQRSLQSQKTTDSIHLEILKFLKNCISDVQFERLSQFFVVPFEQITQFTLENQFAYFQSLVFFLKKGREAHFSLSQPLKDLLKESHLFILEELKTLHAYEIGYDLLLSLKYYAVSPSHLSSYWLWVSSEWIQKKQLEPVHAIAGVLHQESLNGLGSLLTHQHSHLVWTLANWFLEQRKPTTAKHWLTLPVQNLFDHMNFIPLLIKCCQDLNKQESFLETYELIKCSFNHLPKDDSALRKICLQLIKGMHQKRKFKELLALLTQPYLEIITGKEIDKVSNLIQNLAQTSLKTNLIEEQELSRILTILKTYHIHDGEIWKLTLHHILKAKGEAKQHLLTSFLIYYFPSVEKLPIHKESIVQACLFLDMGHALDVLNKILWHSHPEHISQALLLLLKILEKGTSQQYFEIEETALKLIELTLMDSQQDGHIPFSTDERKLAIKCLFNLLKNLSLERVREKIWPLIRKYLHYAAEQKSPCEKNIQEALQVYIKITPFIHHKREWIIIDALESILKVTEFYAYQDNSSLKAKFYDSVLEILRARCHPPLDPSSIELAHDYFKWVMHHWLSLSPISKFTLYKFVSQHLKELMQNAKHDFRALILQDIHHLHLTTPPKIKANVKDISRRDSVIVDLINEAQTKGLFRYCQERLYHYAFYYHVNCEVHLSKKIQYEVEQKILQFLLDLNTPSSLFKGSVSLIKIYLKQADIYIDDVVAHYQKFFKQIPKHAASLVDNTILLKYLYRSITQLYDPKKLSASEQTKIADLYKTILEMSLEQALIFKNDPNSNDLLWQYTELSLYALQSCDDFGLFQTSPNFGSASVRTIMDLIESVFMGPTNAAKYSPSLTLQADHGRALVEKLLDALTLSYQSNANSNWILHTQAILDWLSRLKQINSLKSQSQLISLVLKIVSHGVRNNILHEDSPQIVAALEEVWEWVHQIQRSSSMPFIYSYLPEAIALLKLQFYTSSRLKEDPVAYFQSIDNFIPSSKELALKTQSISPLERMMFMLSHHDVKELSQEIRLIQSQSIMYFLNEIEPLFNSKLDENFKNQFTLYTSKLINYALKRGLFDCQSKIEKLDRSFFPIFAKIKSHIIAMDPQKVPLFQLFSLCFDKPKIIQNNQLQKFYEELISMLPELAQYCYKQKNLMASHLLFYTLHQSIDSSWSEQQARVLLCWIDTLQREIVRICQIDYSVYTDMIKHMNELLKGAQEKGFLKPGSKEFEHAQNILAMWSKTVNEN